MIQFLSFLFLSFTLPLSLSLNQEGLFLQQLKLTLYDPSHSLTSWNPRDDTPCNWFGIRCDNVTRRVNSVLLDNLQLAGRFPTILCRLPDLTNISFFNNSINTSLPPAITGCRRLKSLNIQFNLLEGPLPDFLVELPNLKDLNLAGNSFTGDIPARYGEFPRIETLNLAGNLLNGIIPDFLGNVSSLKELMLAYNPFSPSQIPSQFGNLTNLEYLWLADCNLIGTIPSSLGRLGRLWDLDLSDNRLTGLIPNSLTELKSIVQIELYNNSLSGELPSGFSNTTTLRRIDVSMNELTGSIPTGLCELELESLNLYVNKLEGTLPESIAKSPNLYNLKLFNNMLTGHLPSQLGLNSPLQSVDVSYNHFSGEVPENLCAKGALEDLIMIYNSFSGKIPESLGKCRSLGRLRLKENKLVGKVPQELWGLPRIYLFELQGNSLSGSVSKRIASAHNLSVLLISKNQFSGVIPNEIGYLSSLVEFSASDNKFTGPIPGSLVNLNLLSRLVLSNNELSGGFPSGIQGWKSLNELNLANNKLSGLIADEIGSLPVLNYLDLSGNYFSGKIPLDLQKLKLNLLNLSNNRLSGEIPPFYAKEIYRNSFIGNPGLYGDLKGLSHGASDSKKVSYAWILRSIFILAGIVFVLGILWLYFKCRKIKKAKKGMSIVKWRSFYKLGFSEFEIRDCLKEDNLIGSGASGKVYKVMLSNGGAVAVKKLNRGNKKDDSSMFAEKDEFDAEVETLGKIRHKNIVRLWCCCNTGDCKLLVYEYMPNGSLGDLLHGGKASLLDWPTRYKIALDAAEGLSYLHHDCVPPIVHRDVKSNNILLDGDFSARVADFGVAKVVQGVNKRIESMSVIAGSCGYIAPEYAYTLRVNEKSDIYSFGVVILELVAGRLPIDPEFGEKDLVKWVCTTLDQKGLDHVIDPKLDLCYKDQIWRVLNVGLRCSSTLPISRPSMRQVVKMLQEAGTDPKGKGVGKKEWKLCPYLPQQVDQATVQ